MKLQSSLFRTILCVMLLALAPALLPAPAQAEPACGAVNNSGETCTDFACLFSTMEDGKPGILTNITDYISKVIGTSSQKLYEAFTGSSVYTSAVNAAVTLMIIIYALGFMIGVAQPSFGQVLIRLIKVGIIFTMISPSGWSFFSQYAVQFFNKGTDEIIGQVMAIGTGGSYVAGTSPFLPLDGLAKTVVTPDFIVMILGSTFASGPYGLAMGALLGTAMIGLIKLLLDALLTYALSFVMRSLLFGVAPLFVVFLLFEKTKGLFTGWLNALINLSIKPILYFTFISFFLVMLQSSAKDMFNYNDPEKKLEMCWQEGVNAKGSANKTSFWHFKVGNKSADVQKWDWRGSISCRLEGKADCDSFPVNIVNLLSFLILIYVAQKFATVVDNIAAEISNSAVNISKELRMMDVGKTVKSESPPTGQGGQPRTPPPEKTPSSAPRK